jgi:uncharacterized protein
LSDAASEPARSSVEVVRELSRRFTSGDADGARQLFHPSLRIQQPESLPHGGWHDGLSGMGEMGAAFGQHWDRTIGEARIFGDGDDVVQVTSQTWTAKETGRSATVDVVELFGSTDGLISEIRVFQQDTATLLATLNR